jgi:ferredoxin-NADP reductase
VVTATRTLTPDILEADLRMEDPPALAFTAGQWISVPFGPKTVRAYSIASTPRTPSTITLSVDVAPGGLGSVWFRELAPGLPVSFKGPLGGFVFDRADARRPLFIAEEIGIVPIRAMLLDLDEAAGDPGAVTRGAFPAQATLVYWARDAGWLVYDEAFQALAGRRAGFRYRPVAGTSLADAIASAATGLAPASSRDLVAYVAGGAATIATAREVLMARGLDRKSIKWEKFYG